MKSISANASRNANAGDYLEIALVASVTTVICVRLVLAATGYPRIGHGHIHVAHVLWGGVLLMTGAVIFMSFIGRAALRLGALLSGAGFGLFVDEIGKFLTANDNYFYKPALPMIYLCFILMFLGVRAISRPVELSDEARHRNEAVNGRAAEPLMPAAVRHWLGQIYRLAVANRWVLRGMNVVLVVQALNTLLAGGIIIWSFLSGGTLGSTHVPQPDPILSTVVVLASLVSGGLILVGSLLVYTARLRAYQIILAGTLTNIFIVQIFNFYQDQLSALLGLALNIFILGVIRYGIAQEQAKPKPD